MPIKTLVMVLWVWVLLLHLCYSLRQRWKDEPAALTSYEHLGVRLCSKSDEVLLAVLMCEHDIGLVDPWLSFFLRLHPVSEPDPCMLVPRLIDYSMKGAWE